MTETVETIQYTPLSLFFIEYKKGYKMLYNIFW